MFYSCYPRNNFFIILRIPPLSSHNLVLTPDPLTCTVNQYFRRDIHLWDEDECTVCRTVVMVLRTRIRLVRQERRVFESGKTSKIETWS